MGIPLVLLHQLTRGLNIAGARRDHTCLLRHSLSHHQLVMLSVSTNLRVEGDQVALAHSSSWLLERSALSLGGAGSHQVL